MSLQSLANVGPGGAGFQGTGAGSAYAAMKELQGLNIDLLAGANADTKIEVAAIRDVDTIVSCLEQDGTSGILTDRTANTTIVSVKASGTLTGSSVISTDAVNVAGKVYTIQAGTPTTYGQVQIGADDDGTMLNLKNAINAYEMSIERGGAQVVATVASAVVTVTSVVEGTAGNSIVLTSADATITASGSGVLAGGTATGGISISDATTGDKVLLVWFNKS